MVCVPFATCRQLTMADLDHNQAEPSDLSVALDVEQLDLNLYRSRNLSLPHGARGVFGGRLISQALVVATKCVKPEFLLHVGPCSLPRRLHPKPSLLPVSLCMYVPLLKNNSSAGAKTKRCHAGMQGPFPS